MATQLSKDEFWDRVDDVQAGMLALTDARPVPMTHYPDPAAGVLWFITAQGTDIAEALATGERQARYILASGDGRIYARIDGRASLSADRAKLDEIWNAVADAWFDGGKADGDVRLVRFDLDEAEVWLNDGGLKFLFEIAKAKATDARPDTGAHGTLRFAA